MNDPAVRSRPQVEADDSRPTPDPTIRDSPTAVELSVGAAFEVIETHISRVFVGENEVFKIKKAVDFGFLDFTTLEKRRQACAAEVELNRRLAPDVYLGVVPLCRGQEPGSYVANGAGPAIEWAVWMRKMRLQDRADVMLQEGRLEAEQISALSGLLATFHDACESSPETAGYGRREVIRANIAENFVQTRDVLARYLDPQSAREIERWQVEFLDRNRDLFSARVDDGRIRDGHGDLRLEHIYFESGTGRIVVLDCIEFNDRFRFADVASDIAFLAMDLSASGAVDLSEQLVAQYSRFSNDYELYPLLDFYESYRAFVRGKVLALTEQSESTSSTVRDSLHRQARHHFLLSQASERRPLQEPRLIAVGGWIASGKSTVADQLGRELQCPVISADWTRKWLLGHDPTDPVHEAPFAGSYGPATTARVYREVLQRADSVLRSGRSVVVDASFRSSLQRALFRRLAGERGYEFRFVECRASKGACRERLETRSRVASVSDGRLEIFDRFVDAWEDVNEIPPGQHVVLDTTESVEQTFASLRATFRPWLAVPASG